MAGLFDVDALLTDAKKYLKGILLGATGGASEYLTCLLDQSLPDAKAVGALSGAALIDLTRDKGAGGKTIAFFQPYFAKCGMSPWQVADFKSSVFKAFGNTAEEQDQLNLMKKLGGGPPKYGEKNTSYAKLSPADKQLFQAIFSGGVGGAEDWLKNTSPEELAKLGNPLVEAVLVEVTQAGKGQDLFNIDVVGEYVPPTGGGEGGGGGGSESSDGFDLGAWVAANPVQALIAFALGVYVIRGVAK